MLGKSLKGIKKLAGNEDHCNLIMLLYIHKRMKNVNCMCNLSEHHILATLHQAHTRMNSLCLLSVTTQDSLAHISVAIEQVQGCKADAIGNTKCKSTCLHAPYLSDYVKNINL